VTPSEERARNRILNHRHDDGGSRCVGREPCRLVERIHAQPRLGRHPAFGRPDLGPGMVVVAGHPPRGIDLPARDADGAERVHLKDRKLLAASRPACERNEGRLVPPLCLHEVRVRVAPREHPDGGGLYTGGIGDQRKQFGEELRPPVRDGLLTHPHRQDIIEEHGIGHQGAP